MTLKTAIYTISTRCSAGDREDLSGPVIVDIIKQSGGDVVDYKILPDDQNIIASQLMNMTDKPDVDLILTTGGTGLSVHDVTPEATLTVIERRLPGFEEVMRMSGFQKTPFAVLSRAVAGTRGRTLIVNLPGNPKGVKDNLSVLMPILPHAVNVLQDKQIEDAEHVFKHNL